jgi:hypothetical protein
MRHGVAPSLRSLAAAATLFAILATLLKAGQHGKQHAAATYGIRQMPPLETSWCATQMVSEAGNSLR